MIWEAIGVRRTRAGHILIELSNKAPANELAERLKSAISQETEIVSLSNRVTLEIKNIDPYDDNMCKGMNIQDKKWIRVKSLSMGNIAGNIVPQKSAIIKIKTGLIIVTARVLPNMLRCYRCHMLGQNAIRCTVISRGKELCRNVGSKTTLWKHIQMSQDAQSMQRRIERMCGISQDCWPVH